MNVNVNVNEQSSFSAYSLSRSNMLQVDLVPSSHLVSWCLWPSASPWSLVSTFTGFTPAGMCGPLRQFSAPGSSKFQLLLLKPVEEKDPEPARAQKIPVLNGRAPTRKMCRILRCALG